MFQVIIGGNGASDLGVMIEGCPSSGLDAVDYRRKYGLPEAPTNTLWVPRLTWTDEEFIRETGKADSSADVHVRYLEPYLSAVNAVGEVCASRCDYCVAEPEVLAEHLKEPTDETGRNLVRSILGAERRSKVRAEAEAAEYRAKKEADAKRRSEAEELCKDLIDGLRSKIKYLEGEVAALRNRLEETEEAETE